MQHMKKLNKGLENKIISMQQKITELVTFLYYYENTAQFVVWLCT